MNNDKKRIIDLIKSYKPLSNQEYKDKKKMLSILNDENYNPFKRDSLPYHFTSSSFVLNEDKTKVLFCFHLIYKSYSYLGGHVDNNLDFEYVARNEAKEETNLIIKNKGILSSIEILPVKKHLKNNKVISPHYHLNLTYIYIVKEDKNIFPNLKENKAVKWIHVKKLKYIVKEKKMLPIYEKLLKRSKKI